MGYPIFDRAMSAVERIRGEIPPWRPKPKKRPPQFDPDSPLMAGLADLDDLELREFGDE